MAVINVYGAGLAGCEAAWQAAKMGVQVKLYEMKPKKKSPAHHADTFAELVCSNSLRSAEITNAAGLLNQCIVSITLCLEVFSTAVRNVGLGYINVNLLEQVGVHEVTVALVIGTI